MSQLPPILEWGEYDVRGGLSIPNSINYIGCFRILGLWCLLIGRGLVSVEMDWIMVRGAYNRKGATANNNGCGVVGQEVARQHHQMLV